MRRKIATVALSAALVLAGLAAAPSAPAGPVPAPLGALAGAEAAVTKSLSAGGGGSGNVSGAGDRLGRLLSGWAVPVLIALGGCLLVGSLLSRNVGASVGVVVIVLVGLIFLLAPSSIESAAKAVAGVVF
jgi:hypothetical protein